MVEEMIMTKASPRSIEELELSKEVLAEIARNTSNAVIITGMDEKICYVNEGFERITGYSSTEVLGLNPGTLLQGPDTDPATVEKIRAGLNDLKRVQETILNYTKSGRTYWLQLDIFPLFDKNGEPQYFMAIESDVTELKENERIAREQNERIRVNISYAELLQSALFRNQDKISGVFDEIFIVDRPKDKVGGDFYLIENIQGKKVVLLGDCTGHGVSGAIMTALSISAIKENLDMYKTLDPEMILTKSIEKLSNLLSGGHSMIRDSFDGTLLFIDEKKKSIRYASTGQSIYLMGKDIEKHIKKKRGKLKQEATVALKGKLDYEPNSMIYLCSDGWQDQFGGPDVRKFGSHRVMEFFTGIHQEDCQKQQENIMNELKSWQGTEDQTDDIMIMGIRLN